jgi:malate dehydrogenase (oxaloacetate-decarboxylating)(NADP+)
MIMNQEVNFVTSAVEANPSQPDADELLIKAALDYHRFPTPGKITVLPTKDMTTQRDLALAYSPGVAAACLAIKGNPLEAANLTSR